MQSKQHDGAPGASDNNANEATNERDKRVSDCTTYSNTNDLPGVVPKDVVSTYGRRRY